MSTLVASDPTIRNRTNSRRPPSYLLAIDGTPIASLPRTIGAETLIGRSAHLALHLARDRFASSYHALIRWDDILETHVISDCDSRNGTFVDDVRVASPVRLVDGALIRIGQTELFYRSPQGRSYLNAT